MVNGMNISAIKGLNTGIINFNNFSNRVLTSNTLERSPAQDTVSFSGKHNHQPKVKPVNPNTLKALELAGKMDEIAKQKNMTLADLESLISLYSDDVKVRPIEDLKNEIPDAQNYGAFYTATMNPDFKPVNKTMFVNLPDFDGDPNKVLSFIMNSSHEFTHVSQMDNGKAFEYLKTVTKGNYDNAKAIMALGDTVFKIFDNQIQAYAVLPAFSTPVDMYNVQKYKMTMPRKAHVSKDIIPQGLGLRSEKEFKSAMSILFSKQFNTVLQAMLENDEVARMIPDLNNVNRLYSKVKTYCAIKAQEEKEAYTTESMAAKKALNTQDELNIDIYPIYYDMLAGAFS